MAHSIEELITELEELHLPNSDWAKRKVCQHCAELCHSHSGLLCDDPTDGLYPCDTMKIVERYKASTDGHE